MNLPAHGTTSLDPSKASLHKTTHTRHSQQHYRLEQPQAPLGETSANRLVGPLYCRAPVNSIPTVAGLPPGGTRLVAKRHSLQRTSLIAYRLADIPVPSGAIPVE